jgi:hypothetical protein
MNINMKISLIAEQFIADSIDHNSVCKRDTCKCDVLPLMRGVLVFYYSKSDSAV